MRLLLSCLLLLMSPSLLAAPEGPDLVLESGPAQAWIEVLPDRLDLNFDLFVHNRGEQALVLREIEMRAFDAQGRQLLVRRLDGNGVRPSLHTVPERNIAAGQAITVFNPFPSFAPELLPARLQFTVTAAAEGDDAAPRVATLEVHPRLRTQRARLRLPLGGRVLNWDGHDAQAHHRRFDYRFAPLAAMGFASNFMRYGYDFVQVDEAGAMHSGDGSRNQDWPVFGAPVLAAGDGRVVAASDVAADDRRFDESLVATRPMVLFGNHVVIDHGHGEFSLYAHLQQASATVRAGDRVRAGQPIARVGASGSALFPHLHFELRDGVDTRAEGLPSCFADLQLWPQQTVHACATPDSGRIAISAR